MISYMIFRPGFGDVDLYVRRRRRNGASQEYWDFVAEAWVSSESADTKVFLTEVADTDFSSLYSLTVALPTSTSGTYVEEVYQTTTGDILQQDLPATGDTVSQYTGKTLQELFDIALARMAGMNLTAKMSFMDSANLALDVIYKRLLVKKSDLIKASFTRSITAEVNSCFLPDDFFGFFERPYFSGYTTLLDPLPLETRANLTTSGTPRYHELRGQTLYLHPTPSIAFTLVGNYMQKQTVFSTLADAIPFNGLIDYILLDAILKVSEGGMAVIGDPVFRTSLYSQLEELLPFRSPRKVSFLQTIEGSQRGSAGPSRDYWG